MASEFAVKGAPRVVADAIEQLARAQGSVTALVVPWESSASAVSMSVTSVKKDGWAIEHTNLGTIILTSAGDATRVAAVSQVDPSGSRPLAALFDQFVGDIERRLEPDTTPGTAPGRH